MHRSSVVGLLTLVERLLGIHRLDYEHDFQVSNLWRFHAVFALYREVCYIGRNKCTRSILYTRRLPYTFRIRFIRTVGFVISVGFIISIEFFIPVGFVLSDGSAISVRFVLTVGHAIYRLDSLFSEIHYNARFTSIITAKTPENVPKNDTNCFYYIIV